jgi:hypothetical protein
LTNATFARGDLHTYAPTGDLQLVTMFDSFHHLEDPSTCLARLTAVVDRFFLIEPAGNRLGQWRESHDFDWLAVDLDLIREKLDDVFGVEPYLMKPAAEGPGPTGEPVERRYTYDDFERFFEGFTLTVTGTSSGLVTYPPSPGYQTTWRDHMGHAAYELYRLIDERLVAEQRDLWSRHWAILAVRGPRAGGPRSPHGSPLRLAASSQAPAYGVEYQSYSGPTAGPAGRQIEGDLTVSNVGLSAWATDGTHPTNVSYRWLSRDGVTIPTEQIRTGFPRAILPGQSATVPIKIQTPDQPGRYVLVIDLVREGVTWFSERGVPPLRLSFRVTHK